MARHRNLIPGPIMAELDRLTACGVPWSIRKGKKHFHLIVDGHMAAILPRSAKARQQERDRRVVLNARAHIRRVARREQ